MPSEIERKFLLTRLPPEVEQSPATEIEQGYLVVSTEAEVRVRRAGEAHSLTLKRGSGEEREEIEIAIDADQLGTLWQACEHRLSKRRHLVPLDDDLEAEVDVYSGSLDGLRVVEVEFPSREAAASFEPPRWFGREVTGDRGYANQTLAIAGMPKEVSSSSDNGSSRKYAVIGKPLGEEMTRIAGGRAKKALERLQARAAGEEDAAEAIHGVRKDMKKLRTVLRLLRNELPKAVYGEEKERYREAARKLSGTRDAEVKLETLEALVEHAEELPGEAVESWRKILDSDREAATDAARDEPALAEARELIEAGCAGIERWQLEEEPWKGVREAFVRVYRRGRRAMRAAEAKPSEDELHQWRKRAKDLRYGLELIEKAWSGPLGAAAEEADRLSDLLGDHHDLAVLREDLHERRLGEEETRRLEAAIGERQQQLAADAFDLGHRLYAESPKRFGRRLDRYWAAWRG
jgi:CYTH domain-containing protein/CHAD domain-containing protein